MGIILADPSVSGHESISCAHLNCKQIQQFLRNLKYQYHTFATACNNYSLSPIIGIWFLIKPEIGNYTLILTLHIVISHTDKQ